MAGFASNSGNEQSSQENDFQHRHILQGTDLLNH